MTINSHSEPIGRIVDARKLRIKSSGKLGVVKKVESISIGQRVFEIIRYGKSRLVDCCQ